MSRTSPVSIIAALLLSAGSIANAGDDGVAASFDRMLNHEPTTTVTAPSVAREADPLLIAVARALWLQSQRPLQPVANRPAADAGDRVLASFDRMLRHEPTHASPALPAGSGEDPLFAAVVVPLRSLGLLSPVGPLHAAIPHGSAQH